MSSDLDFNELDKAVNSLVKNQGAQSPDTNSPSSNKNEPSSSLKPHAGRGKFMDVVHPASDMTTVVPPTSTPADDLAVPAVGKTVTPANEDIKPDPIPEKDPDTLPVTKQLSPIDDPDPKSLVATPDITETTKPDPLEEAAKKERERVARDGAKQRKAEHKVDKKSSEPDHPLSSEEASAGAKDGSKTKDKPSDEKAEVKPLFLEDAKVEKRPLGAFNEQGQKTSEESERPALEVQDDTQKTTSPPPPPEFDKAVVELEASDEALTDEPGVKSPPPEKQAAKKATEKFSIPPQYKPAEKQEAKETSIYEPASFDAFADSHTPSTTKPWMWVIIFLGIIALGVALSLGTFFVVGTN